MPTTGTAGCLLSAAFALSAKAPAKPAAAAVFNKSRLDDLLMFLFNLEPQIVSHVYRH